jgi:hypothetical protein
VTDEPDEALPDDVRLVRFGACLGALPHDGLAAGETAYHAPPKSVRPSPFVSPAAVSPENQ